MLFVLFRGLGWVFHTVRGGINAGDFSFRPSVVGVVDARKNFRTSDGTLSSPGCAGFMYEPQPISDQPAAWSFHTVRDGVDPGEHHVRSRGVGVVEIQGDQLSGHWTLSSRGGAGSTRFSQPAIGQRDWGVHIVWRGADPGTAIFIPRMSDLQ